MTAARICAVESNRVAGDLDNPRSPGTAGGGCPHMVTGGYQRITAILSCLPTFRVNFAGEYPVSIIRGSVTTSLSTLTEHCFSFLTASVTDTASPHLHKRRSTRIRTFPLASIDPPISLKDTEISSTSSGT